MARCPDCYSIKILSSPERGNGECAVCYGTGHEGGLSGYIHDLTIGPQPCPTCYGTKQCKTCGGTGEVKSYEIEDNCEDEEESDSPEDDYPDTYNATYKHYSSGSGSYTGSVALPGVLSGLWSILGIPCLFILSCLGEYWAGNRLVNQTSSKPFTDLHLIIGLVCLPGAIIVIVGVGWIIAKVVEWLFIGSLIVGALLILILLVNALWKAYKTYQVTQPSSTTQSIRRLYNDDKTQNEVNVRANCDTKNCETNPSTLIGKYPNNTQVKINGNVRPVKTGSYTWIQVTILNTGQTVWVADNKVRPN
jgi:hypothetical protein